MTLSSWVDNAYQALAIDEHRKPFQPAVWDQSASASGQVLEQVWFAGSHSDVGGSYQQACLSDITLTWMISKARACQLEIDETCMTRVNNPKPDSFGPLHDSQNPWYKIAGLGDYMRPMGERAQESVSNSAVARLQDAQSNYKPSNLTGFLARGGPVTKVV
jgi:hypothetical protein